MINDYYKYLDRIFGILKYKNFNNSFYKLILKI